MKTVFWEPCDNCLRWLPVSLISPKNAMPPFPASLTTTCQGCFPPSSTPQSRCSATEIIALLAAGITKPRNRRSMLRGRGAVLEAELVASQSEAAQRCGPQPLPA